MTAQWFDCSRGGARARVQQRDVCFTPRESLIENRKVTNDQSKQAKAHACFQDSSHSRGCGDGREVAQSECGKGGAAVVKIGKKARRRAPRIDLRANRPMDQSKRENQSHRPNY